MKIIKKVIRFLELVFLGVDYCDKCDSTNLVYNSYDQTVCRDCGHIRHKYD